MFELAPFQHFRHIIKKKIAWSGPMLHFIVIKCRTRAVKITESTETSKPDHAEMLSQRSVVFLRSNVAQSVSLE